MLRYGRVLIVDGPMMRKVIRPMLVSAGFMNIDELSSGEEALPLLDRLPYVLVVADWNLAPVTGMDLLVYARNAPRNRDVPFVMMTGKGQKRFAAVGRDNGATRYIEKPFTAEGLVERVREASAHLVPAQDADMVKLRRFRQM